MYGVTDITSSEERRIPLATAQGMHLFRPSEITRLQANSNYTYIYFTNRKPLLISKVLKTYEPLLTPLGFVRTHQSHLVNTRYVRFIDRHGMLEMEDASRVEISRSKRKAVLDLLKTAFIPGSQMAVAQ